jgi:hypothetical protein
MPMPMPIGHGQPHRAHGALGKPCIHNHLYACRRMAQVVTQRPSTWLIVTLNSLTSPLSLICIVVACMYG